MPVQQLSTFNDILNAWAEANREAEKRAVWRLLARGGWLQACRNAVRRHDRPALQAWLDAGDAMRQLILEFNGEATAQMARVHLQCGLIACGQHDPNVVNIESGFCKDLTLTLSDLP